MTQAIMPSDPTPNPVAAPGNEQWVVPKNPFTSTAMWGLAVLLITAAVKRWVPNQFQSAATPAAIEGATTLVGTALIAYGRWTANRPLGLSGAATKVTVKLLPALLACSLLFAATGCSIFSTTSPKPALTLQGETLATVLNVAADARDSGLLTQAQLNSAKPDIDAYLSARAKAEQQIANGASPSSYQSLIAQANAAWTKLEPEFLPLKAATNSGVPPSTRPS